MINDAIANMPKRRRGAAADSQTTANKNQIVRFKKRLASLYRAWKFGNFIVARCGSEVRYINLADPNPEAKPLNLDLGTQVHLQKVVHTGVDCLLQFFLINDTDKLIFVITWNMQLNREHNLFQTRFKVGQFPENLLLSSFGGVDTQGNFVTNFNFVLEDGCIINLEDNVPIQFFDKENELDLVPRGAMKPTVSGQKKVSRDRQYYLDILTPGRIQMFISLSDLIYWERFQNDR